MSDQMLRCCVCNEPVHPETGADGYISTRPHLPFCSLVCEEKYDPTRHITHCAIPEIKIATPPKENIQVVFETLRGQDESHDIFPDKQPIPIGVFFKGLKDSCSS
jgi:hypothetical protein